MPPLTTFGVIRRSLSLAFKGGGIEWNVGLSRTDNQDEIRYRA